MSTKNSILLIEDEDNIIKLITAILKSSGYSVTSSKNGREAESLISSYPPDLILLDLGLPDIDGTEIIKNVRKWSNIPIIVISARDNETDKVESLDMGADDYITKPFGTSELLARIRTALRHKRASFDEEMKRTVKYEYNGLAVDFDKHQVKVKGKEIHLTQVEFKMVELLCKYSGRVLTYDYILKQIWGPYAGDDNKILRVNMANIRRKIEENPAQPEYIFTEAGVGYRMADEE